jgi:hypothetical protein
MTPRACYNYQKDKFTKYSNHEVDEMRKTLCMMMLCTLLVSVAFSASAGTSIGGSKSTQTEIPEFLFINMKDGIGCGLCPVYTAPSLDAYRCNNGKAECATDYPLYIGGFNAERWLLVRYSTNSGGTRVGYIPPNYVKSFTHWQTLNFSYVATVADATLYVTDNPLDGYSAFATLDSGETYYILGDYNYHGDWWYIECTVDGKVARGFIEK